MIGALCDELHVAENGLRLVVSWRFEEVQNAGNVGSFVVLPHKVDQVYEVLFNKLIARVKCFIALLFQLFFVEFVVLAELLRFLVQAFKDIGFAFIKLLAVDALLWHLEWNLQRHKLFFRSDHLFLIEVAKVLKRLFGSQLAVFEVVIRAFFKENAGDDLVDAFIEFGKLVDKQLIDFLVFLLMSAWGKLVLYQHIVKLFFVTVCLAL